MKLTPDSLTTHLAATLLPAYLISGDEPLIGGETADAVRAAARSRGFTEREVHFIERASDWDEVRAAAANLSLFGLRRVLEIRLGSGKPGTAGSAALLPLLTAPDPDTVLLVLTPRLDREAQSAAWVRAFESHGGWVQVWPVDAGRLVGWLRARCRRLGLEADDAALEVLAAHTEGNLLAAHQELAKLTLLTGGARITADTVMAGVADSARFDVFQLSEAVLAGDAPRALRMLAGLRAEGTEATLVLWALLRALRELWSLRTGLAPAEPWQRRGAALAQAARRAPRLPFARLTARAAGADRMIKGRAAGDAWDELTLLAAELCAVPLAAAPALAPARAG